MTDCKIVVSLTTFPARIGKVHLVLEAMKVQTHRPDRIVLCLCEEEFPGGEAALPDSLRACLGEGVEILWCAENLKPHKKYFHTMRKYPEAAVITVDDDLAYPPDLVEQLVSLSRRFPGCVCARRAHLMSFDGQGRLLPYARWPEWSQRFVNRPSSLLFPTGCGGVLYPPGVFQNPDMLLNAPDIRATCLSADDVWLKFVAARQGVKVVVPRVGGRQLRYLVGTQANSLKWSNQFGHANDGVIAAVSELLDRKYPSETGIVGQIRESGVRDALQASELRENIPVRAKGPVRVSVVLPVYNVAGSLGRCLDSLLKQTLGEIEIVCVDDGSTDDTADVLQAYASRDPRVGVIWSVNRGAGAARNLGLKAARGEYVLFHDPDDFSSAHSLKTLYRKAVAACADVVICGRFEYDDSEKCVLREIRLRPEVAALPDGFRIEDAGATALRNVGLVPWNKLVRRAFLMETGIRFQEIPRNNDVAFSIAVVGAASRMAAVNGALYFYCVNREDGLQSGRDSTPTTILMALAEGRRTLARLGRLSASSAAYAELAVYESVKRFAVLNTAEALREFHQALRREIPGELALQEVAPADVSVPEIGCLFRELQETDDTLAVVLAVRAYFNGRNGASPALAPLRNGMEAHNPVLRTMIRAIRCLDDNGFGYTLRRIFFGRQY